MILQIFILLIALFSLAIHEISHGSAALALGDPTARDQGRLTLNPIKHLDLFGSIIFPLMLLILTFGRGPIFGWTKPVPVNPYNFRDKRWGNLKVALAGPLSNFLLGIIFGLLIRFGQLSPNFLLFFSLVVILNFSWALFNLVPVPPLDGSHILFSLLPKGLDNLRMILQRYSLVILVLFLLFGLNLVFSGAGYLYLLVCGRPF